MLRLHNAINPAKIATHHEDGRQTEGLHRFSPEMRLYHAWADMGLSKSLLSKRKVGVVTTAPEEPSTKTIRGPTQTWPTTEATPTSGPN